MFKVDSVILFIVLLILGFHLVELKVDLLDYDCSQLKTHKNHRTTVAKDPDKFLDQDWFHLAHFSPQPQEFPLNCTKLRFKKYDLNSDKTAISVTGLLTNEKNESSFGTSIIYALAENPDNTNFTLFSDFLLVSSNWIALSKDSERILYVICGNFADGSSGVGEIGILGRAARTELPNEVTAGFHKILTHFNLDVQLQVVSNFNCQNF